MSQHVHFVVVLLFFMVWIEEMYVWYLSTLFVWPQFVLTTNKPKRGDCWVFEYWVHLLLKQISLSV